VKALPIIIIAVVVVVALVRLFLRRRGQGTSPRTGMAVARLAGRGLLGDTGLVARREIRERLRGRIFWGVTVILLGVVTAAVVIPTLRAKTTARQRVGVVAGSAPLEAELHGLANSAGLSVAFVNEPVLSQARAALSAGQLDMVVDGTGKILVKQPISASDTSAGARFVRAVSVALGAQYAFAQAGLTPQQAATVAKAKPIPVESIQPGKKPTTAAEATALLGVILIFVVLTQYLTWTLMGVMEEKASRVVEVLLATVRPIQLLAGKVIGIGAVALAQAVALVAFALVLAEAVGSSLVRGAAPLVVAATLTWLVLGYAFYSWVYAAAGSLAERQDQVQSLALPLSVPLIFGYLVSLIGASSGTPSLLVKVLAYLPPTAPFAMPTLIGFGEATWWQFLLSVAVTLVCTLIVASVAARVYRTAVLQTGRRVRLRELLPTLTK
jgi:ABC-2 type transport system permease protein